MPDSPASADLTIPSTTDGGDVSIAPAGAPSPHPPPGHLGTFALLGAAIGTVPMPWVPATLARRVRGALVRDIAARHGVRLSAQARAVLADPANTKQAKGALMKAFGYLGRRILVRYGPLAILPPLRSGLETYVLGHLLDRYLSRSSTSGGGELKEEEAWVVRRAIEEAIVGVASTERGLAWPGGPDLADSRDELTQAIDGLLTATATIPAWLLRRLDLAFDDALRATAGE